MQADKAAKSVSMVTDQLNELKETRGEMEARWGSFDDVIKSGKEMVQKDHFAAEEVEGWSGGGLGWLIGGLIC